MLRFARRRINSRAAVAAFDPATLNLSGWWRADYAGPPWDPTASAGASLANGPLLNPGLNPSTGDAKNGRIPAKFIKADTDYLYNDVDASDLFTTVAGSILVVFKGASADAPDGDPSVDAPFYRANDNILLTYTTSGVGAVAWDGWSQSVYSAAATGSYHVAMMRWTGSVLGIRVDGNAEVTTACGNVLLAGGVLMGLAAGGGPFLDASVLEFMTSPVDLSASYASIRSYFDTRYAL